MQILPKEEAADSVKFITFLLIFLFCRSVFGSWKSGKEFRCKAEAVPECSLKGFSWSAIVTMASHKPMLDLEKEESKVSFVKPLSSVNEHDAMVLPKEEVIKEHTYGAGDNAHENKRIKLQDSGSSTLEKLRSFFETVQKQHPESRLELQYVDGNWKVWCGACKKFLRPDKSGKAIHNIQRQHFSSSRHRKKLHLMLQTEEAAAERQKKKCN